MVRAVFLDRDGVVNRPLVRDGKPYAPQSLSEFVILDGVLDACRSLKAAGYKLIVATNQPDVGRGTLAKQMVLNMHAKMCRELPIDRVEVCYDSGSEPCDCRKPAPGMLLRAAAELNIDLRRSYMVGDRWRDVSCGLAAGCTTILIDYGYKEEIREEPHFRVATLSKAAEIILKMELSGDEQTA